MNTVAINSQHRRTNKIKTVITSLWGALDVLPLAQHDIACFLGRSQSASAFSSAVSSDAD